MKSMILRLLQLAYEKGLLLIPPLVPIVLKFLFDKAVELITKKGN